MKKISLVSLVAIVAIGCSEVPSAPGTDVAVLATQHTANLSAFRPPPPAEYIADVSSEYSGFTGSYFLNGPGTNGWISFDKQQPAGTTVDANARISYHQGTVSGTGTLVLSSLTGGAPLTIDLKSGVIGSQWSSTCTSSCGSLTLRGTTIAREGGGKVTRDISVNLRNPAYNGDVVIGGDFNRG